ncbi:hypothetical protein BCR39DRAFT_538400 [Naematelia encephala]|uniref:Uncharacterized protein n=1 Tax=Naematelia encephala TaxID=71784 RepID=A0A1Y2AXM5_9TREE|nr:hypothetical protein BCR39DRAFT_538400 [Naematelia encephala]
MNDTGGSNLMVTSTSNVPPSYPSTTQQPSSPAESTPHLSDPATPQDPDTPFVDLRTPGKRMDVEVAAVREEGEEGLGFGEVHVVKQPSRSLSPPPVLHSTARSLSPVETLQVTEFPDEDALKIMQTRIQELESEISGQESAQLNEVVGMLNSLLMPALQQLPFLREQIQAQKDTIKTMQQQSRLSEQLAAVERDRHVAERAGWHSETRALQRQREAEIAAGARPKKLLDLDVGYHQELEAANKRLEMDNRLMAPRLADTQRQIDRLVTELRHLRSHVVLSSQILGQDSTSNDRLPPQFSPPSLLGERRKSVSPTKASSSRTTMGDARTEHLLLAARKVRSMRLKDDRVGRLTLAELQRGGVVGPHGGIGYSEGYAGQVEIDEEDYESDVSEHKPSIQDQRASISKGKAKGHPTPLLPRSRKSVKKPVPQPTTPSRSRHAPPPETTPGGSNFSDLLRAAEMADRPTTPTRGMARRPSAAAQHAPMSTMSATRSTTRTREETASELGSPIKRPRRASPVDWEGNRVSDSNHSAVKIGFPTAASGESRPDDSQASALDILAQASSLDVAQSQSSQPQLGSGHRFGGMLEAPVTQVLSSPRSSNGESTLGPAIDLRLSDPPTPRGTQPSIIEDHQIDPALTETPATTQAPLTTPRNKPRTLSQTSDIHTPARRFSFATPGHEGIDDTPTSRSEYLGLEPASGAFASPTGAAVPGLGKYVHLSSTIPARRIRSPYLKWTVEEDELLARAVAMHGEKWDLVSKGVPTRSYHQVRQRWLRKTGAFDKKPSQDSLQAGTPLRDVEDDEEETSPTPESRGLKKRKMQ